MVVLKIWNFPGCCKQEPVQNPPNQSFERNENGTKMFWIIQSKSSIPDVETG